MTGTKTWYVRYQQGPRSNRTWRRYKAGDARSVSLAKATEIAQTTMTKVQVEERDPHADRKQRRTDTLTFGVLFDEWYERYAKPNLARAEHDYGVYKDHLKDGFRAQGCRRRQAGRDRPLGATFKELESWCEAGDLREVTCDGEEVSGQDR